MLISFIEREKAGRAGPLTAAQETFFDRPSGNHQASDICPGISRHQSWLFHILCRGDESANLRPSSRLGSVDCIDDRALLFDKTGEHSISPALVKPHDYPAAEEESLSRVTQDGWVRRDHLHRVGKTHLAQIGD